MVPAYRITLEFLSIFLPNIPFIQNQKVNRRSRKLSKKIMKEMSFISSSSDKSDTYLAQKLRIRLEDKSLKVLKIKNLRKVIKKIFEPFLMLQWLLLVIKLKYLYTPHPPCGRDPLWSFGDPPPVIFCDIIGDPPPPPLPLRGMRNIWTH